MQEDNQGILYWLTGLPGAGKTTIGTALYYKLKKKRKNVVLLDGDVLLNIFKEDGFSREERLERAGKYARLCQILTNQDITVVCCTLSLFDEIRNWNRQNNKSYVEIYIEAPDKVLEDRNYRRMLSDFSEGRIVNVPGKDLQVELPQEPDLILVNDGNTEVEDFVNEILNYDVPFSKNFDRDTSYWNNFYSKTNDLDKPSLFAETVMKKLDKGKSLLDLGCGNGRDSLYFMSHGMKVTAVDASDMIINQLTEKYKGMPIEFICDDFVCAETIYQRQYDYCYSRFSLHAINEEQEERLVKNIYDSLCQNGRFFIEVRSINDDIYGKGKCVGRNSYIYNGHFRRFIVKEELLDLLSRTGFRVEYAEEKRGFAPLGNDDPPIIRVIVKK